MDWAGSLRSESCSMFVSTVYIGAKLDSDAQVTAFSTQMRVLGCSRLWQPTAPYFRQGMMERLNAIPIVTAVFPCGEEEIAYSGVMTTALHNILRGHRRRDDDELVPVRLPQGDLLLFDVVNAIKRQVTAGAFLLVSQVRACPRCFVLFSSQPCLSSTSATPVDTPLWRARMA